MSDPGMHTLGTAARATGRSKSTIKRAIESGRLSATKEGLEWRIDPAELARVYPPAPEPGTVPRGAAQPAPETDLVRELRARIEAQERSIADLRAERDRMFSLIERERQLLLPAPGWWRRIFGG